MKENRFVYEAHERLCRGVLVRKVCRVRKGLVQQGKTDGGGISLFLFLITHSSIPSLVVGLQITGQAAGGQDDHQLNENEGNGGVG